MELACLGLNHKTAPVEVRERFAVGNTHLGEAARSLLETAGAAEGVSGIAGDWLPGGHFQ